jgi:type II restriction enzyme
VIVAPDEDRDKVMTKASLPLYSDMNVKFFPYSAVDELYGLCQRRKLTNKAVNEEFLDCYMESVQPQIAHH